MKLHNSVTETTDRGLYATLNRVQRIRELSKDFLLIGRNAWLSQQISPNSTMKILGTKLIEVCCGLFETLDLDWSSPSTLSASDLASEGRELYSSPLFSEVIFQPYQYRFFFLNFCKAAAEVIIQTYWMRVARHFRKICAILVTVN